MKLYKCILMFMSLGCATVLSARPKEDEKVHFAYDVNFEMNFDNRELYRSNFSESMTVFGARLTPAVGLEIPQYSLGMNHRLMVGVDIMKDFGESPLQTAVPGTPDAEVDPKMNNLNLFRELTLYYRLEKSFADTGLELYAGIFPRRAMGGNYSEVFFSDSLKFYDNNLEGLLIKVYRPKSSFEVGCDWFGRKGFARKEKFMIFSSGESLVTDYLRIGYSAYMYHFAGSLKAGGVVDNILLNPYVKFDVAGMTGFQELSLKAGWVQAMQHDRELVGHYVFPAGGEFDLTVKKWNVGIRNMIFYGTDMMPYYNSTDTGGDKYGTRLYLGDPFFRVHDKGGASPAMYNRLDIFYEPHVGKYLSVRIGARFHFNGMTYSGCQQIVGIVLNLNDRK